MGVTHDKAFVDTKTGSPLVRKARFIAVARHTVPSASLLAHGFVIYDDINPLIKPAFGEGICGSACPDDKTKHCGCSNEPSRMFYNPKCGKDTDPDVRMFAVYQL